MPVSSEATVYVVSRVWRSVNDFPSVTRYCIVSTLVVSMVGAYTSESTPPATVYQILEVVFRDVPRQSLRARPKWLVAPGPSVAAVAALAGAIGTSIAAATLAAAMSTVAVLRFIPSLTLCGRAQVTTLNQCQTTSSGLPELSISPSFSLNRGWKPPTALAA